MKPQKGSFRTTFTAFLENVRRANRIIVGLHCGFEFRETTSVEFKSVPKDF